MSRDTDREKLSCRLKYKKERQKAAVPFLLLVMILKNQIKILIWC